MSSARDRDLAMPLTEVGQAAPVSGDSPLALSEIPSDSHLTNDVLSGRAPDAIDQFGPLSGQPAMMRPMRGQGRMQNPAVFGHPYDYMMEPEPVDPQSEARMIDQRINMLLGGPDQAGTPAFRAADVLLRKVGTVGRMAEDFYDTDITYLLSPPSTFLNRIGVSDRREWLARLEHDARAGGLIGANDSFAGALMSRASDPATRHFISQHFDSYPTAVLRQADGSMQRQEISDNEASLIAVYDSKLSPEERNAMLQALADNPTAHLSLARIEASEKLQHSVARIEHSVDVLIDAFKGVDPTAPPQVQEGAIDPREMAIARALAGRSRLEIDLIRKRFEERAREEFAPKPLSRKDDGSVEAYGLRTNLDDYLASVERPELVADLNKGFDAATHAELIKAALEAENSDLGHPEVVALMEGLTSDQIVGVRYEYKKLVDEEFRAYAERQEVERAEQPWLEGAISDSWSWLRDKTEEILGWSGGEDSRTLRSDIVTKVTDRQIERQLLPMLNGNTLDSRLQLEAQEAAQRGEVVHGIGLNPHGLAVELRNALIDLGKRHTDESYQQGVARLRRTLGKGTPGALDAAMQYLEYEQREWQGSNPVPIENMPAELDQHLRQARSLQYNPWTRLDELHSAIELKQADTVIDIIRRTQHSDAGQATQRWELLKDVYRATFGGELDAQLDGAGATATRLQNERLFHIGAAGGGGAAPAGSGATTASTGISGHDLAATARTVVPATPEAVAATPGTRAEAGRLVGLEIGGGYSFRSPQTDQPLGALNTQEQRLAVLDAMSQIPFAGQTEVIHGRQRCGASCLLGAVVLTSDSTADVVATTLSVIEQNVQGAEARENIAGLVEGLDTKEPLMLSDLSLLQEALYLTIRSRQDPALQGSSGITLAALIQSTPELNAAFSTGNITLSNIDTADAGADGDHLCLNTRDSSGSEAIYDPYPRRSGGHLVTAAEQVAVYRQATDRMIYPTYLTASDGRQFQVTDMEFMDNGRDINLTIQDPSGRSRSGRYYASRDIWEFS